ncbi:MAG TPA: acetyl-CoA carboxylase biotin carboxyl carrier protein [Parachlamydiaceae bacterium]|nr:acetyl-CoA carboxylase biotin carboxyl carrier protein [Parachlamydiaceae bacterium]
MELKQIKELMAAMGRTCMKRLSIKDQHGFEIVLEREEHTVCKPQDFAPDYSQEARSDFALRRAHQYSSGAHEIPTSLTPPVAITEVPPGVYVTSPMVGTYYASPSPDDPPFLKVGDKVDPNTIVCIVEAMKVMNEVKAGVTGIVAEILPESGHPVEFGTKLIRVTPL